MKLEKLIYLILDKIKTSIEKDKVISNETLNNETFNVSFSMFYRTMKLLENERYIIGLRDISTHDNVDLDVTNVMITTNGLDYLNNNSTMEKIKKQLKDIRDII